MITQDSAVNDVFEHYQNLESHYPVNKLCERVSYSVAVNFSAAISESRHRWYNYKEGFSPQFVRDFFNKNNLSSDALVLDPFCGVGTTCIQASLQGINSIGFDVSPLTIFIGRTKSINLSSYEIATCKKLIKNFLASRLNKTSIPPLNDTVTMYYEEEWLDALLAVKYFINNIYEEKFRDIFKLAFLNQVEKFSTHRKAGNGVKKKTNYKINTNLESPIEQIRKNILLDVNNILFDCTSSQVTTEASFFNESCFKLGEHIENDSLSCVLTSPPYPNCFDYSKIYMRELWLGDFFKNKDDQKSFRNQSIRSHVHATWLNRYSDYKLDILETKINPYLESLSLWTNKIPDMLCGYFSDIGALLDLMKPKLRVNAKVGLVVGNAVYGGIPVATDLLIAELAESLGYKVIGINIYRKIVPSSQQLKQLVSLDYTRESLVLISR